MNNIGVLIDFTETCRTGVKYSCQLANTTGARLQLFHVFEPDKGHQAQKLQQKVSEFCDIASLCTGEYDIVVVEGDFLQDIPDILEKHNIDLVMIATHGVKGIFHTIQGADVLQLVRRFSMPSLVVQEHTPGEHINFERILLPISTYTNYDKQVAQTAAMAKVCGSLVQILVLTPEKGELDQKLKDNLGMAKKKLEEKEVNFEVVEEASKVYEVGYAKQAIEYASNHNIHLLSILSFPSEDSYFGNVERSDFILNQPGIPVLCCTG